MDCLQSSVTETEMAIEIIRRGKNGKGEKRSQKCNVLIEDRVELSQI